MTRQELKEEQLRVAMAELIMDTRFQTFIGSLRDMREDAIGYMIDHTTVKDQRESLAAAGEVRALDRIISVYRAARDEAGLDTEDGGVP